MTVFLAADFMAASDVNIRSPLADDERERKNRSKKKVKGQPAAGEATKASGGKALLKSSKMPEKISAEPPSEKNNKIAGAASISSFVCGGAIEQSPAGGRKYSYPLLTIAEEEETAVDPVRRGSRFGLNDEDEKSLPDPMDTFDDVRCRRNSLRVAVDDADDEDDDEDDSQLTQIDVRDMEFELGSTDCISMADNLSQEVDVGEDDTKQRREKLKNGKTSDQRDKEDDDEVTRKLARMNKSNGVINRNSLELPSSPTSNSKSPQLAEKKETSSTSSSILSEFRPGKVQRTSTAFTEINDERKDVWFAAVLRGDMATVEKLVGWRRDILHVVDAVSRRILASCLCATAVVVLTVTNLTNFNCDSHSA